MATQAERTAAMRARLLDATVRCLADRGYAGTSTTEVCRLAGVSRGAQLHHFPTKSKLVAAAVQHLFQRRLGELARFLAEALGPGHADLAALFGFLWSLYRSDTFYAWLELLVASRTDPELHAQVVEIDRWFSERAEELCAGFLKGALARKDDLAAATRLVLSLLDGLATHRIVAPDEGEARRVLALFLRLARPR